MNTTISAILTLAAAAVIGAGAWLVSTAMNPPTPEPQAQAQAQAQEQAAQQSRSTSAGFEAPHRRKQTQFVSGVIPTEVLVYKPHRGPEDPAEVWWIEWDEVGFTHVPPYTYISLHGVEWLDWGSDFLDNEHNRRMYPEWIGVRTSEGPLPPRGVPVSMTITGAPGDWSLVDWATP